MFTFKPLSPNYQCSVIKLISTVSAEDILPCIPSKARTSFLERIKDDVQSCFESQKSSYIGAFHGPLLVGIVGYSNRGHISQLFVDRRYQKQGIGTQLVNEVLSVVSHKHISVNASLNAWEYYAKLGFSVESTVNEHFGIQYLPMKFSRSF
jgi:GNAT superfamily N-acetyltransferase